MVLQSFEQAEQKKNAGLIYNWAVKSRKGNNMILHCYSEIGEHDYDKLVSLLEERSAKTLGITNHEINDKERNRMAGPR